MGSRTFQEGRDIKTLQDLAQQYLLTAYATGDCWRLVRDLLVADERVAPESTAGDIVAQCQEVWSYTDPVPVADAVLPWDILLMARKGWPQEGAPVGHCGLVLDARTFIHVRPRGDVAIETLQRWHRKVVNVGRILPQGGPWLS